MRVASFHTLSIGGYPGAISQPIIMTPGFIIFHPEIPRWERNAIGQAYGRPVIVEMELPWPDFSKILTLQEWGMISQIPCPRDGRRMVGACRLP